jgi:hypothetical protein
VGVPVSDRPRVYVPANQPHALRLSIRQQHHQSLHRRARATETEYSEPLEIAPRRLVQFVQYCFVYLPLR